eukprot:UN20562
MYSFTLQQIAKDSQNLAADVFGDQAYVPADFVPAAKWEGIYDAVIDFHLAGSFDHLAFTPHSSFSEFTAFDWHTPRRRAMDSTKASFGCFVRSNNGN